jgi:hypothetical protein
MGNSMEMLGFLEENKYASIGEIAYVTHVLSTSVD